MKKTHTSLGGFMNQYTGNQKGPEVGAQAVFNSLSRASYGFNCFVHETTWVDQDVTIGNNTRISRYSQILHATKIGAECDIAQNVVVGPDAMLGNHCTIQNNVMISGGVRLEDNVFCGTSVVFADSHISGFLFPEALRSHGTLVRKKARLGPNVTIFYGVIIGKYAYVAPGSVITNKVPNHALMTGNPAIQDGWICVCGARLRDNLECTLCGIKYVKKGDTVQIEPLPTTLAGRHDNLEVKPQGLDVCLPNRDLYIFD